MDDLEIIDEIELVRANNNANWMDIVRIALDANPKATKNILRRVLVADTQIKELMERLIK